MKAYVKKTRKFYANNTLAYFENTKDLADKDWVLKFSKLMNPNGRILDVGCAFGRDSKLLMKKGFDIYGIDLSNEMISEAKKYVKSEKFYVMDMSELKFVNNIFDGVWCAASLLHIKKSDVPSVLNEFNRVLKKKGLLYLSLKEGTGEGFEKDLRYNNEKKFFSYFKEAEIKNYLEKSGFEIVDYELKIHKPHPYRHLKNIFLIARKK